MESEEKTILIVDDDTTILKMLAAYFVGAGYEVREENNGERAMETLQEEIFDVVITDLIIDTVSGMDILKKAKEISTTTEVIIITGHSSVDTAVEAMKLGAFEYITKPVNLVELNVLVQKANERRRLVTELKNLRSQIKDYSNFDNIVATGTGMQSVMGMVKRIARSNSTVMIEGESGTGKEVIARAIHSSSLRSEKPFVAINCGALPENLLESELFGYVKGAFTGANATKKGLFEEANGGTIFLDEIGETKSAFQVKLLRVLQENEIRRVGDTRNISVDVRVLASSNNPIKKLVDDGLFRQDLYYRLSVIPLVIPPLRERREDIVPLVRFYIERFCRRTNRKSAKLGKRLIKKLEEYAWPGNVRELVNSVERAMIMSDGVDLKADDFHFEKRSTEINKDGGYDFTTMSLKEMEKQHIIHVLENCRWHQKDAAKNLGIGYNTLWRKIKEYNIEKKENN